MNLTGMEMEALEWLKGQGGSVLITAVPEKNTRGVFGIEAGLTTFKKLQKKGLVIITDESEEPFPDMPGFTFTPTIDIV